MKIAFLVNSFPALSETFILNQITGLIDRGHDVSIYAIPPVNIAKIYPNIKQYQLLNHTHYVPHLPEKGIMHAVVGIKVVLAHLQKNPQFLLKFLGTSKCHPPLQLPKYLTLSD